MDELNKFCRWLLKKKSICKASYYYVLSSILFAPFFGVASLFRAGLKAEDLLQALAELQ